MPTILRALATRIRPNTYGQHGSGLRNQKLIRKARRTRFFLFFGMALLGLSAFSYLDAIIVKHPRGRQWSGPEKDDIINGTTITASPVGTHENQSKHVYYHL